MNLGSTDYYKKFAALRALGAVAIHEIGPTSNFYEQNWLKIPEICNQVQRLSIEQKRVFLIRYCSFLQNMNVEIAAYGGERIDAEAALREVCTEFHFYPAEHTELRKLA